MTVIKYLLDNDIDVKGYVDQRTAYAKGKMTGFQDLVMVLTLAAIARLPEKKLRRVEINSSEGGGEVASIIR